MNFDEIKKINKIFDMLNSCEEFIDYINATYENKKLFIIKDNNELLLRISNEYLFKSQIIDIPLVKKNKYRKLYCRNKPENIIIRAKKLKI